jgi:phage I-like protein
MTKKAYATWGLSPWSADGKPPLKFRLFKYGENRSTKGTVFLTRESAKKCLSAWIDYGNDLSGDYNHAVTNPAIEAPRASCWFSLALEQDGLYAVNVRWTPAAHDAICNKEFRYYSPYFAIECDKFNRPCVVEIINVALTNTPATKNQRPLVGLSKSLAQWSHMLDQKMIDALKALFVEKGGPEASASDFVLGALALMESSESAEEAPMPSEEMPLVDPSVDPKKEEMPMGAEQYQQAFSLLQDQVKGLVKKIEGLELEKRSRIKDEKEELFVQFKREGRLALVSESAARKLLDMNPALFRETFGSVKPLSNTPPASPALKSVSDIASNGAALNLVAPSFTSDEVNNYMTQNKVDQKTAMLALSRIAKGNK